MWLGNSATFVDDDIPDGDVAAGVRIIVGDQGQVRFGTSVVSANRDDIVHGGADGIGLVVGNES